MIHIEKETAEEIRQYILMRLGYPAVRIELTQAHLDEAIKESLTWFARYSNVGKRFVISKTKAGVARYNIDQIIPEEYILVDDVIYDPHIPLTYFQYFFSVNVPFFQTDTVTLFPIHPLVATFEFGVLTATYHQMLRVFGREGSWRLIGNKELILHPVPQGEIPFAVFYTKIVSSNEIRDLQWVKDYSLAVAKEMLGRIRSKYNSYPSPTGEVSLDGERLLEEAKEEKEKLKEALLNYAQPTAIFTG